MKKKFSVSALLVVFLLLFGYQTAFAHESITIGDYEFEIGWVEEPAIVGQQNGILVIVADTSSGEAQPVEDVSALEVTVSYGGQSRVLTLQPLGEDTPGQFMAPIIPMVAGQYTIILGGQLGVTTMEGEVNPEEVASADILQFPSLESSEQSANSGNRDWLIYLSVLIGLIALVLAMGAIRNSRGVRSNPK